MAFPQVADTNSSTGGSNTTSHTVDLPANIVAGNLLLILMATDGNPGISFPAGWNEIKELPSATNGSTIAVAWREADGEEGASITVTTGSGEQSTHYSYRITGAIDPDTQPPEVSTGVSSGSNTNPNPDELIPTGGAKDYLWFAFEGCDGENVASGFPTNYGNTQSQTAGTGGGECSMGVARRELNAISEDPGAFTIPNSQDWAACTVGIHPEAAVGGTNLQLNIGDDWKAVDAMQINIGDDWKAVAGIQVNIGDDWKEVF